MGTLTTSTGRSSGTSGDLPSTPDTPDSDDGTNIIRGRLTRQTRRNLRQQRQRTRAGRGAEIVEGMAPGVGDQLTAGQRPGVGAISEAVRTTEEQQAEDLIEEREEVLEEPGGFSSSTEELGDDENEEAKALTRSIRVLYSFNPIYTSEQFIESLNPRFRKIKVDQNASEEQKQRIEEARSKAGLKSRTSILIGRMSYEVGKARVQDFRAMTRLREPRLFIDKRRFMYSLEERDKLRELVSDRNFKVTKITEGINSYLDVPQFEKVESPIIINKFELQNQFRLSPIDDAPIEIEIETGTVTSTPSPSENLSERLDSDASDRSRIDRSVGVNQAPDPDVSRPDGPGFGDIDTGLIRDLERDRQFSQQDFGAESRLGFDRLEEVPPPSGPGRGPSGGGGGY